MKCVGCSIILNTGYEVPKGKQFEALTFFDYNYNHVRVDGGYVCLPCQASLDAEGRITLTKDGEVYYGYRIRDVGSSGPSHADGENGSVVRDAEGNTVRSESNILG